MSEVSLEAIYEKLVDLEKRISRIEAVLLEVKLPKKYLHFLDKLYKDIKEGKNLVPLDEVERIVNSKD